MVDWECWFACLLLLLLLRLLPLSGHLLILLAELLGRADDMGI